MNNMTALTTLLNGNKTYLACALGALVIIANHFGVQITGVTLDPNNWLNDLWNVVLIAAARSAAKKIETTPSK